MAALEARCAGLVAARRRNPTQALLWHTQARHTEYFSRWIELKEEKRRREKEQRASDSGGPPRA